MSLSLIRVIVVTAAVTAAILQQRARKSRAAFIDGYPFRGAFANACGGVIRI